MDINGNVTDGIVGEKRSSGCVRMKVDDAKWFFDNIEEKSKCIIK
ncbi:MAG: L,D-transpeptidase family protein [Firmicutes bacterium]|nr:L,D-transpeptidase family protein [Bacillota bacterium]